MNISYLFNRTKQQDKINDSAKDMLEVVESYKKAMQDGVAQYNDTRKKAEEQINRGGRITRHQINL